MIFKRIQIISFSKKLARENRELGKRLTLDIESIDRQIDQSPIDAEALKLELAEKNSSLEELRDKRMRGNQVRSREEFIKGWEKPSKFFLNLEKKNYINKTIVELIDEDKKL